MRCCWKSTRAPASAPKSSRRPRGRRLRALLLGVAWTGPSVAAFGQADAARPHPPAESARAAVVRAYERGDYARVVTLCAPHVAADDDTETRGLYAYYLGAAQHRLGESARALALWTQLLNEAPDGPYATKALLAVGLVHAGRGDWPACQAACERLLIQAPPGPDAVVAAYWRAEALAQQGAWEAARQAFEEVLRRPEDHALKLDARVGLIDCLVHGGQPTDAVDHAERLAADAPAHPELGRSWLRIAQAARNGGDAALAVAAAERALARDATLKLDAALVLAEVALLNGDASRAAAVLAPLLAARGSAAARSRLLTNLGWAAYVAQDYTRAVAVYEQAASVRAGALRPADSLRLGLSHIALGNDPAALLVLAPLQGEPALEPHASLLNAVLVDASLRAGHPTAALRLLHTGLRAWPGSPHTVWRHERIARILAARRAWNEAAEAYRAASAAADEGDVGPLAVQAAFADARAQRWSAARRVLRGRPDALSPPYQVLFYALRGDARATREQWGAAATAYRQAAQAAAGTPVQPQLLVRAARAAAIDRDGAALAAIATLASPSDATAEIWVLHAALAEAANDSGTAHAAWLVAAPFGGGAGARARLAVAWEHLAAGRPDEAVPYLAGGGGGGFERWGQYGMALSHLEQGAYRVAAAECFSLADQYADTPLGDEARLRAAEALNRAGAWREAEDAFRTADGHVQSAPARRAAALGLAWTLARHGFEGQATTVFQGVLAGQDTDADAAQALLWLGRTAFERERYAVAGEVLSRVLLLQPRGDDAALAEYWLARSLFEREQYVSAAATFAGCRRRPAAAAYEPQVGYWEVRCAAALGDDAAVLANAAALRRAFPTTRAWLDLEFAVAQAHQRREAWAEALAAYDRVAAGNPGVLGAQAMVAGAACLEATGDFDGAVMRLFRVRPGEVAPEIVADARLVLGRTLVRAGRPPEARTVLQDVVKQYPDTDAAHEAQAELARLSAPAT